MTLIVRRVRVTDLPLLEAIERARQERLPHRVGWIKGFRKLIDNTLAAEPEGILVAEDDGVVVGYGICRERQHDPITGVKYGQIVVFLPVASRYQLEQPPVFHTERSGYPYAQHVT